MREIGLFVPWPASTLTISGFIGEKFCAIKGGINHMTMGDNDDILRVIMTARYVGL